MARKSCARHRAEMAIITLTSDLGLKDYYVGSIKGAIYREMPTATVVDISHEVPKFDIAQAAFIVANSFREFPEGSIHIIGVNPEETPETPHVVVVFDGHYFIGADNGIFSLIFEKEPQRIMELTLSQDTDFLTFPTKDVFVKAACHLARGGTLSIIGKPLEKLNERMMLRAVVDGNTIRGMVIYIDSYGNVITNITSHLFKKIGRGRPFTIQFRVSRYNITHIHNTYKDVPEGEKLALFGSTGFLEVAINHGNANGLLGLRLNDIVRVEFE